jgi:hypothetical protein
MRAREVDQLGLLTVEGQRANVALDGNAGIVTDTLLKAGQPIKQGALAGIGATNNCNPGFGTPSYSYLTRRNSNFRGFSHQPLRV